MFFRLFCWKNIPFLRPKNVKIKGKLFYDFRSSLFIDNKSEIEIDGNFDITGSQVIIINSSLEAEKIDCLNVQINLYDSEVKIKNYCQLRNGNIHIKKSKVKAGNNMRLLGMSAVFNDAEVNIGDYFLGQAVLYHQPAITIHHGKFSCETNCRLQAYINIEDGYLKLGSNVFINHGTFLSCRKLISMDDYTMISYDSVIFDNNSHRTEAEKRREEVAAGFPNGAIQNESNRPICADIIIGKDVWIGVRCFVLKGVTIGNNCIVAAGTKVLKDIPENTIFTGKKA